MNPNRPSPDQPALAFSCARRFSALLLVICLSSVIGVDAKSPPLELLHQLDALPPADGPPKELLDQSADISGNIAVVGFAVYEEDETSEGTAHVYVRGESTWGDPVVLRADDPSQSVWFGGSVAVDEAHETIVVGDLGYAAQRGAAFVYVADGTGWIKQQKLLPSDPERFDGFGNAVAISGDTVVVGANGDDTSRGAAYVFVRDGDVWTQQTKLVANDRASFDSFGAAVAIHGDTIVVGAWGNDDGGSSSGSVYVFRRSGDVWSAPVKLLGGVGGTGGASLFFGRSVAADGNRIAVGAPGDASGNGAAYVFVYSDDVWSLEQRVTASDGSSGDLLGRAVALEDDTLIVGAPGRQSSRGGAYAYGWDGLNWLEHKILTDANGMDNHQFGRLLGISGARIIASTYNEVGAATFELSYADPTPVAEYVRKFLYFEDAAAAEPVFDRNSAAFRYKHQLYGEDSESGEIRARHELMPAYFGAAERERSLVAEAELRKALALNPDNGLLGNLLLDVYYDRATAETILSKTLVEATERARFGPPLAPPPPTNGFIIDSEIPLFRDLLATSRTAMADYFTLLSDDLGLSVDPPSGYTLFRNLVPDRGLMAATYTDDEGATTPVADEAMLFSGYKDLVLLFELLREHGRAAHSLARLLVARDAPGDLDEARTLIAESERFLYLQGSLLESIFSELPEPGDPSGLAQAIAGWSGTLESLANLRQIIAGEANLLGFAPDFLMLIENFTGPGSDIFDSYDVFKERLSLNTLDSTLRRARDRLETARDTFDQFRGYESQVLEQFDQSTISYEFRLFEIIGARPGEANYTDVPTANPGSELDQQYRSIELARLKIQRNQAEIDNLAQEVQIEINRAADVSAVFIKYGNQQADITERIGHIRAAQAAANALADIFSAEKILTGASVAILLNGAVQTGGEVAVANLEADKERLAAAEQAEIEGIDSAARVKTLLLGMHTLAVDSAEAALLMRQEIARMAALYREKTELENRIAERNRDLASRYFADPVHRLAADWRMIEANLGFEEAQRWLFFMVRALEFKWNTPFSGFAHEGRTWSARTLFKLRNADELESFFDAMNAFDASINRGKTYRWDWFSVREDFMGLKTLDDEGQPAEYIDPVTGETHDAIGMFRAILERSLRQVQGGEQIEVEFNTVRQTPGGFFFVGPTFNLDGSVDTKGRFLDKIDYLQIRLPGDHSLGRSQLAGNLTYGGTSFVRNFNVGHYDLARPDRLVNEMTAYNTRYWFFDPTPGQQRWKFNEGLTIDAVEMQLSDDPRLPPTVNQILEFKERSVAATGWRLTIPLIQQNTQVMKLNELNDIEIYFHHYSAQRQ